mmetsp:Transcript_48356/g.98742  ORF Transcript_48356/g.98742 Transcript_48356/m.98742 type:complete len:226 (-) Transcript_48356:609-1286(-)
MACSSAFSSTSSPRTFSRVALSVCTDGPVYEGGGSGAPSFLKCTAGLPSTSASASAAARWSSTAACALRASARTLLGPSSLRATASCWRVVARMRVSVAAFSRAASALACEEEISVARREGSSARRACTAACSLLRRLTLSTPAMEMAASCASPISRRRVSSIARSAVADTIPLIVCSTASSGVTVGCVLASACVTAGMASSPDALSPALSFHTRRAATGVLAAG